MLRKFKENIFPHPRRQVHAIVHDRDGVLTLKWHMAGPGVQLDAVLKSLEAAHTLAFQDQAEPALDQQTALQLLDLQGVLQRTAKLDHLITRFDVQVSGGNFTFAMKGMRLQMAQVNL